MPVRDGVSVVGEVAATTPVLMLTYSDEPEVIAAAIEAGASGYLVHGTFGDDEFESSVREVARGGFVHARDFKHDPARLYHCYPIFGSTFTFTHTNL